jgi:deazaflavin-dependent oxidoreductase (nitroreductase family)
MTQQAKNYRRMVNAANGLISGLQRLGVAFGPMQLLTVPGRRTGQPRTFPLAVLELGGGRYLVQAFPGAAWVANVRAAGTATLKRGRRRPETVRLVEVGVEERRPLLREAVRSNPPSVAKRYVTTGLAEEPTPEGIAAAAERIAVFRVEPA